MSSLDGACFTSKTVIRMEDGGDGKEAGRLRIPVIEPMLEGKSQGRRYRRQV
jgi:hypothetical protein